MFAEFFTDGHAAISRQWLIKVEQRKRKSRSPIIRRGVRSDECDARAVCGVSAYFREMRSSYDTVSEERAGQSSKEQCSKRLKPCPRDDMLRPYRQADRLPHELDTALRDLGNTDGQVVFV